MFNIIHQLGIPKTEINIILGCFRWLFTQVSSKCYTDNRKEQYYVILFFF